MTEGFTKNPAIPSSLCIFLGKDVLSMDELRLIDLTTRMFTEPVLELNRDKLVSHLTAVQYERARLLDEVGLTSTDLRSAQRFAELLENLGVDPPKKISPRTGRETYAFAKTDAGMQKLLEHEWRPVAMLAEIKLGVQGSLEEGRTTRFLDIQARGPLPVPLQYHGAHPGRWSGAEKINLQNLSSRGSDAGKLRDSIEAPEGYVLIVGDSSQIEARSLGWIAGQDDLTEAFQQGRDVYKAMGADIFRKPIEELEDFPHRFVGKETILGAGYQMGGDRFYDTLRMRRLKDVDHNFAHTTIQIYRKRYPQIPALWRQGAMTLQKMMLRDPNGASFGRPGVFQVDTQNRTVRMPHGLYLRYPELQMQEDDEGGKQMVYRTRGNAFTKIYGGKFTENAIQGFARGVVGWQMCRIAERWEPDHTPRHDWWNANNIEPYRPVLTEHDSIGMLVKEEDAEEGAAWMTHWMRTPPPWAEGRPITCKDGAKIGRTYGETKRRMT